jgi:hypothetical protein
MDRTAVPANKSGQYYVRAEGKGRLGFDRAVIAAVPMGTDCDRRQERGRARRLSNDRAQFSAG